MATQLGRSGIPLSFWNQRSYPLTPLGMSRQTPKAPEESRAASPQGVCGTLPLGSLCTKEPPVLSWGAGGLCRRPSLCRALIQHWDPVANMNRALPAPQGDISARTNRQ